MKTSLVALLCATLLIGACKPHAHDDQHDHDHGEDTAEGGTHEHGPEAAIIAASVAAAAGVRTDSAASRVLYDTLPLYGRLVISPDAVRSVSARFPGIVRSVQHNIGDAVKAGDVLARVESNESLQTYAVTAPIAGVVTRRDAQPGQDTSGQSLFAISDPSQIWAELSVFPRDLARLRTGQTVRLRGVDGTHRTRGEIVRITPAGIDERQALVAWVKLDETTSWVPGLYVQAQVELGGNPAAVTVLADALQTHDGQRVVFVRNGDRYTAQPVDTGRDDGEYVEITAGLEVGTEYVSANSYLIKAELEKDGAGHDH